MSRFRIARSAARRAVLPTCVRNPADLLRERAARPPGLRLLGGRRLLSLGRHVVGEAGRKRWGMNREVLT